MLFVAVFGLCPCAVAQQSDWRAQVSVADNPTVGTAGQPSNTEATPKSWMQITVGSAKDTVYRICKWRPRLFGNSTVPPSESGKASSAAMHMAFDNRGDFSASLDSPRRLNQGIHADAAPGATTQVLQVPTMTSLEPAKFDFTEDAIALASAKVFPENALGTRDIIYPTQIRDFIAHSCGSAAKDLEVALAPDGVLELQMRADSEQDAIMLSDQIMPLPELKSYRLSLTITTGPGTTN
jgi:hypothetical protein